MSISRRTFVAFGVHVPQDQWASEHLYDECDRLINVINGLGGDASDICHLSAGAYDQDEIFLVVGDAEVVEPSQFKALLDTPVAELGWWMRLSRVAHAAGYSDLGKIGWMVIPDEC